MTDNNIQILVVDDDIDAAKTFAELIESKLELKTSAESDKKAILDMITKGSIKVVVLDQRMPSIKGTELYREIIRINPFVVAIMLTGEADRNEVAEALKMGYVGYLEKNKINQLVSMVVQALAKYEIRLAEKNNNKGAIQLFKWNIFKNRLFTRSFVITNIEVLDESFVMQDRWTSDLELVASEQENEDTYEYEDEILLADEGYVESNIVSTVGALFVPNLKSEINSKILKKFSTTFKTTTKKAKKIKKTYKLQESAEDSKHIIKKIYEHAPVYIKYRILIKEYCWFCKSYKIQSVDVLKRKPYVDTRIRIYYTDTDENIINTGLVSVF